MSGPRRPYDPLSMALHLMGDAWSVLVLDVLCEGPARFNEIWSVVHPIRANALSARLKRLEEGGLIRREVANRPYGVTYSLVKHRYELRAVLHALKMLGHVPWEAERHERRVRFREREEARQASAPPLHPPEA